MAGGDTVESRQLDQTPTWAVAAVCTVIILVSIALEKGLHRLGEVKKCLAPCFGLISNGGIAGQDRVLLAFPDAVGILMKENGSKNVSCALLFSCCL